MTRVARRTYRIKRRKRRMRILLMLLLICCVVLALLWRMREGNEMHILPSGTPKPVQPEYDQTVVTRELLLEAETWYTIQTGVFSQEEAAREKADVFAERGAPGTVVQDGEKWRVFIASYGSETDAAAVRQRLGEQRVETYLYRWETPELRLRLTGMAGQLDVVEAGLSLLGMTARQMRDMALLLDASQLSADDSRNEMRGLSDQLRFWAQTAGERFGSKKPDLAAQMYDLSQAWCRSIEQITKLNDLQALAAAAKGQAMSMYADMCVLRGQLAAQ